MNKTIDLKSALLGLGAGVLVMFGVGAASSPGVTLGRYQLAATEQPSGGSQCFIIDTATGKAWKASVGPNWNVDKGFWDAKNDDK